uniref:Chaperone DnaJ C-terminal domain-containing protein n=1 Tax=Kalanchoe fedtschenkoi TaxID=63787 RepID=A0A7N1A0F7_KALFE
MRIGVVGEQGLDRGPLVPFCNVSGSDAKDYLKPDSKSLYFKIKISLVEALAGYTAQITTLDGRTLTVPINSIISPTYEEVVKGEGMPIPKDASKRGNVRIKFNIRFPARLTTEQKTGIKKLLASP